MWYILHFSSYLYNIILTTEIVIADTLFVLR
jgi:hypothetical protein